MLVQGYSSSDSDDEDKNEKKVVKKNVHSKNKKNHNMQRFTKRPRHVRLPSLIDQPTFSDLSDDSEDEGASVDTRQNNGKSNSEGLLGSIPAPKRQTTITTAKNITKKHKEEEKEEEEEERQDTHKKNEETASNITIFGNLDVAESRTLSTVTSSSSLNIAPKVSSAPQVASTTNTGPLPEGWHEAKDPESGDTYYYNAVTKQTSWDRPTGPPARKRPRIASTGVSSVDRHIASTMGVNVADIQEVDIRAVHDPSAWKAPDQGNRKKKGVAARVWSSTKGATSMTSRVSRVSAHKGQLHALLNQARVQADELAERRSRGMRNKAQVQGRYGW